MKLKFSKTLFSLILTVILISSGIIITDNYLHDNNISVSINGKYKNIITYYSNCFNSSVSGGKAPYEYNWYVNSIYYSSDKNITVTFYTPGIKVITLDVTSKNNFHGSGTFIINVIYASVYINASSYTVNKNSNITFYSHFNGGIKPFKYYWYINGVMQDNHNRTFKHEFTKKGEYNVSLNVSNNNIFNVSTVFNFNPWGFYSKSNYSARDYWGNGNSMANEEDNNSNGYLTFYFYLYNPRSAGSDNITVYLYNKLPLNGPGSVPVYNITFYSGIIKSNSGKWVTVNTDIYWNYSSLVVIPQQQTGLYGDYIGVANPEHFNEIYSHYWYSNKYWDSSDDGFIGYWTVSKDLKINVE